MTDTIAAIATGTGRSAIGIVRLSGAQAHTMVETIFTPKSGKRLTDYPFGMLVYGQLRDAQGRLLDECMATLAAAPHSYTGEDTAELQCHGAPAVLDAVLQTLFRLGARLARAGEFTQRAFLNGRMDLTQAESVIDLIDSETTAAARCAASQLTGALRRRLEEIYDTLIDLSAHFDVVLDYSDEDLEPFDEVEIAAATGVAARQLQRLADSARRGRRLRDGVPCAIIGRPNSGKSSLLNALLGYDRAIVTDIPGTTRDTIEARATVGGVLLQLIDTAGLRSTEDVVERIGVTRAREAAARAELILALVDGAAPLTQEDLSLLEEDFPDASVIYLATKADRPAFSLPAHPKGAPMLAVSSVTGAGIEALESQISAIFGSGALEDSGEVLTSLRQAEAISRAAHCLARVEEGLMRGMTPDALLTDAELALQCIGEVIGRSVTDDVTDRIFSRFCVGK